MAKRAYRHMSTEGRETLSLDLAHGHSLRTMMSVLGRAPSTVSREHPRNAARGHGIGENRIARLMRIEGIWATPVKKWRATTDSGHTWPGPSIPSPGSSRSRNPTGCGPETSLRLDHGGLALPRRGARPVLAPRDRLGNGPPVDWGFDRACPRHVAGEPDTHGRAPAPLGSRQPVRRDAVQHLLATHGITASMSRTGNCWDKACVESVFGPLKRERIYHRQYRTRDEA